MAGKRPDQYQIDPSEGRSTDHKFNPQSSRGDGDLTDLREGDKQRLAESRKGGQPFLPDVPSPSAEAQRAATGAAEGEMDDTASDDTPSETRKENPRA